MPRPWGEILQGYVSGRRSETYSPRFEHTTIRVRGDDAEFIIEDEMLEEKRKKHRDSEVYSSVVRAEKRRFAQKGDEGDFDETVWTDFNGRDVEISAFNCGVFALKVW